MFSFFFLHQNWKSFQWKRSYLTVAIYIRTYYDLLSVTERTQRFFDTFCFYKNVWLNSSIFNSFIVLILTCLSGQCEWWYQFLLNAQAIQLIRFNLNFIPLKMGWSLNSWQFLSFSMPITTEKNNNWNTIFHMVKHWHNWQGSLFDSIMNCETRTNSQKLTWIQY